MTQPQQQQDDFEVRALLFKSAVEKVAKQQGVFMEFDSLVCDAYDEDKFLLWRDIDE